MKITLMVAAAALALSAGGAMAQQQYGQDQNRDHRGYQDDHRGGQDNNRGDQGDHRGDRGDQRGYQDNHGGYVQHSDWRRGHRMRNEDWSRGERVDWRMHHLRRPPRGYEWRQVDGNYVLAAAATGLIASIIANSR